jgi:hypothetical protein
LLPAVDARLPDDLEQRRDAVDDDADLLPRDAVMGANSNPHGGFDEGFVGSVGA